jgi:ubiquitin C-terminal hydrolase
MRHCKAGHYKNDLNPDNPLGMKGEVAEAYGNLIERLWSGTTSSIAPREFKVKLSKLWYYNELQG